MSDLQTELELDAAGGFIYGAGLGVLSNYPRATGDYLAYLGKNSQTIIGNSLKTAIDEAGMNLIETDRAAAPLLSSSEFYSSSPIARLGNAATIDAYNSIVVQYGNRLSNVGMDLSALRGQPQNVYTYANGETFRPDLSYQTFSYWSGNTAHFDEVKAVSNLGGSSAIRQVGQYGRAISEINATNAGMRLLGTGLRSGGLALGAIGTAYDAYSTYNTVTQQLAVGNELAAGLSTAQFVGREGGGLALGAAGAVGGALAGGHITR
jgi:hypothetical protein